MTSEMIQSEHGVPEDASPAHWLDADVIVVGAGPTGLTAALELAKRRVRVLIVDPLSEPDRTSPRCKQVNPRSMENYRRLGAVDVIRATAPLPKGWSDSIVFCTGLQGEMVARFDGVFSLSEVPSLDYPEPGLWTAQFHVEAALRAALAGERSASTRWGQRVVEVSQEADHVVATVLTPKGEQQIRAKYLIGADGSRSVVRKALGIALSGESNDMRNLQVIFRASELSVDESLGRAIQYWTFHEHGHGILGRLDEVDTWWAIIFDTEEQTTAESIASVLAGMTNLDQSALEVLEWSVWNPRMLVADAFRKDRCFLIGDAAHLNPPFGGFGANTGIGDAVDIAWKLSAVLQGWGGEGLLESYEAERRPIAREVIAEAVANMSVLTTDLDTEGIRSADEFGAQVRERAREQIVAAKPREFYTIDFILGQRYVDSPVLPNEADRAAELEGTRLSHHWVRPEVSLYDLLGNGFTWIDVVGDAALATEQMVAAAASREVPLATVKLHRPDLCSAFGACLLLVRPDHVVAWAADTIALEEVGAILDLARGAMPIPTQI